MFFLWQVFIALKCIWKSLQIEILRHLDSHPLFRKLTKEEQEEDPVVEKLWESTEEGQKVPKLNSESILCSDGLQQVSRNMSTGANHGDGVKLCAVYQRIEDPFLATS